LRNFVAALLMVCGFIAATCAALAQNGDFPIKGDDGTPVYNHRISAELSRQVEQQESVAAVGNPNGDVTLYEFYDLNCPYCRQAAVEIADILRADKNLKLVLVPFPVLSIQSIQAGRVEVAFLNKATPQQFYEFHRRIFAGRGVVDGARALAVTKALGVDNKEIIAAADDDRVTEAMKAHVRVGDALGLAATPSFVIKDVAIVGYPGRKSLAAIIQAAHRCGKVVC
jgi:protein-disulfide isomerase